MNYGKLGWPLNMELVRSKNRKSFESPRVNASVVRLAKASHIQIKRKAQDNSGSAQTMRNSIVPAFIFDLGGLFRSGKRREIYKIFNSDTTLAVLLPPVEPPAPV